MGDQPLKPCTLEDFEALLDEYAHSVRQNESSGYGMSKYTQQALREARAEVIAAWNNRAGKMTLERARDIVSEIEARYDFRTHTDGIKTVEFDKYGYTLEQIEAIARVMREETNG